MLVHQKVPLFVNLKLPCQEPMYSTSDADVVDDATEPILGRPLGRLGSPIF